jgi:DNA-binding NtrC family response regulator
VSNGQAALDALADSPGAHEIVFSDVVMPGMDGTALAREVTRLYPDLPVVLTSGYSHVLAQESGHGFELLHKPYSVKDLSRVLRRTVTKLRRYRPTSPYPQPKRKSEGSRPCRRRTRRSARTIGR